MTTSITELRKSPLAKASKVLCLVSERYGLNALGIKKLLQINGTRYNKLMADKEGLNYVEKEILMTVFQELRGVIK